jgi:hypothetical protein
MFRSLTIENFRCFRKLELKELDRVNLIAGMNNTGKTSVLEALRLHCNPTDGQIPWTVAKARGVEEPLKSFGEISRWLFCDEEAPKPTRIVTEEGPGSRITTLFLLRGSPEEEALPDIAEFLKGFKGVDIVLNRRPLLGVLQTDPEGRMSGFVEADTAHASATGFTSTWLRTDWNPPCRAVAAAGGRNGLSIDLFSELEVADRQNELLPTLRILEPRLEKLSLVVLAGEPVIHGKIGLPRLVPLPFMGEGINRALGILLAIATAKGGFVLIDEVENGLHHSVMDKVWQAIADAAARADAQVFATTHSYECIQAAHRAFAARQPYDFRLHRLQRVRDQIQAVTYDQRTLGTSLEMSFEVR